MEKRVAKNNTVKNIILSVVYGLFAAFAFVGGRQIDEADTVFFLKNSFPVKYLCTFIVVGLLFFFVLTIFNNKKRLEREDYKEIPKYSFLIPIPFWIASLLASFPGVFSYDSYEEWRQIAEWEISSHHPVLHEIILGGLVNAFSKVGNANIGILIYVILQIALFTYVLKRILIFLGCRTGKLLQWITVVFFSLSPVLQLYVISTSKDSVFAAFELWFIVEVLNIWDKRKAAGKEMVRFIVASLGTMIFRNNGFYVVLVTLIALLIMSKGFRKQVIVPVGIIAIVYFLYAGPFYRVLGVTKGSSAEMLSVPIQQMGRVYHFDKGDISEKDLELMYEIIPEEHWDLYIPSVSDPIKNGFNEEAFNRHKIEAVKLWIKLGTKHPGAYVNSFLANTVDFWYPLAVNDGYRGFYGTDEDTSDYFDYKVSEPGERIVLLKGLNRYYSYISVDKKIGRNVLASLFINPGWYILLWLSVVFTDISLGSKKNILLHVILLMSLLTVLAGPMAMVRYVLIFFIAWPVYFTKNAYSEA